MYSVIMCYTASELQTANFSIMMELSSPVNLVIIDSLGYDCYLFSIRSYSVEIYILTLQILKKTI